MTKLKDRYLPKWPLMYTTGKPVTQEQAKEIIRRTDTFFIGYSGNNRAYNQRVRRLLGMPPGFSDHDEKWEKLSVSEKINAEDKFRESWGLIESEYVHNNWISSAFVFGPSGWCHPDGTIGFIDNVGKWPSVEAIQREWRTLAKEFPFLDIGVTLYDGESCEEGTSPVVSIRVLNGRVTLKDPERSDVHRTHAPATRGNRFDNLNDEDTLMSVFARREPNGEEWPSENAIPWKWLEEWKQQLDTPDSLGGLFR